MKNTKLKRFYVVFTVCAMTISLCCIMFATKREFSISAGGPLDGKFFINAPAYVAGGGTMNTSTGQITGTVNPLFKWGGGGVDVEVLVDLLDMVNSTSVWSGKTLNPTGENVTYLSAKNFGKYVPNTTKTSTTSQIVVKLFETTSGASNGADAATEQYWQAVYRSINSSSDVLTLYMCRYYTTAKFDDSYGYYRTSTIRNNNILELYDTLAGAVGTNGVRTGGEFSDLDSYVVAPSALPGLWQSNTAQTGTSEDMGTSGFTAGVSKAYSTSKMWAINNGLDGWINGTNGGTQTQTVLHCGWASIASSSTNPYNDKLWLPSNYEVIFKDSTTDGSASSVNASSASSTLSNATTGGTDGEMDGRSGLWELNGYDRSTGLWMWLRSGNSDSATTARAVYTGGTSDFNDANNSAGGVRPALHLDLRKLADDKLAKVSVTADASNDAEVTLGFANGVTQIPSSSINYRYLTKTTSSTYNSTSITLTYDASKELRNLLINGSSISLSVGTHTIDGVCKYTISNATLSGSQKTTQITISEPQTNVAVKYAIGTPVCQVNFKTTFSAGVTSAQDWGIIVYILRANGTGGYAESYSIFVRREETEQTFSLTLQLNLEYEILVYKPNIWQISLDGTSGATKTFTPTTDETHTISVSGDGKTNSYIII